MTEKQGGPEPGPSEAATATGARSSGGGSLWSVLAPAGALLVGLVLGGVLVGVMNDSDEPAADASPGASPTPGGTDVSPTPGATTIVVPDECLEAAESVEQALALVERGAAAIRDFEPDQLRTLLRDLEELDGEARAQADACQQAQTVG